MTGCFIIFTIFFTTPHVTFHIMPRSYRSCSSYGDISTGSRSSWVTVGTSRRLLPPVRRFELDVGLGGVVSEEGDGLPTDTSQLPFQRDDHRHGNRKHPTNTTTHLVTAPIRKPPSPPKCTRVNLCRPKHSQNEILNIEQETHPNGFATSTHRWWRDVHSRTSGRVRFNWRAATKSNTLTNSPASVRNHFPTLT
jgi:hypothetical protein